MSSDIFGFVCGLSVLLAIISGLIWLCIDAREPGPRGFFRGFHEGYYSDKSKPEIDAMLARRKKEAKEAAVVMLPFASLGFMVILTFLAIALPIGWPIIIFWWWRYFKQINLYMKEEH